MASLRDVFQHAGKRVQVYSDASPRDEGKGIRRGDVLLVEARLAPTVGERIVFPDSNESFRVVRSEAQYSGDKLDHYRVGVESILG